MNNIQPLESRVLFATGAMDTGFGTGGRVALPSTLGTNFTEPLALAGGKLLVAGSAAGKSGNDIVLLRYNANGTLDKTFDGDGILQRDFGGDDRAAQLTLNSKGKVMLLGSTAGKTLLARFDVSGSGKIDKTFATNGAANFMMSSSVPTASSFVLRPDDKIILAGENVLSRRFADGSLDKVFGTNGITTLLPISWNDYDYFKPEINGIARLSSGDLLVHGSVGFLGGYILKISAGGKLDTSFASGHGVQWFTAKEYRIDDIAVQKDDKVVVFGNDYDATCYVYRMNPNGTPDKTFDDIGDFGDFGIVPPQTYNATAQGVVVQKDGKIVVTYLAYGEDLYGTGVSRLNADGSIDDSFGRHGSRTVNFTSGVTAASEAKSVLLDSNGQIVLAGLTYPIPLDQSAQTGALARLSNASTTAVRIFNGSNGKDQFRIEQSRRGLLDLQIFLNDKTIATLAPSDYASLQFNLGDGDDSLLIDVQYPQPASARYLALPVKVKAGAGNDTVLGSSDEDSIYGEGGNDSLDGAKGDDFIEGNSGNDTLIGGQGGDRLFGGSGNDLLSAKDGEKDLLDGGAGADVLDRDAVDVVLAY